MKKIRYLEYLSVFSKGRKYKIDELADITGVSKRQVYRDLCELSLHEPICNDNTGWYYSGKKEIDIGKVNENDLLLIIKMLEEKLNNKVNPRLSDWLKLIIIKLKNLN